MSRTSPARNGLFKMYRATSERVLIRPQDAFVVSGLPQRTAVLPAVSAAGTLLGHLDEVTEI